MVSFWIFPLLLPLFSANNSKEIQYSFSPDNISSKNTKFKDSDIFHEPNFLSLKLQNEYVCDTNGQELQISDESFQNSLKISNEAGCISLKIYNCKFTNIIVQDETQQTGQISVIYIKSIDFFLDDSTFQSCYSSYEIPRTPNSAQNSNLDMFPVSDYVICHAIYLDENIDHIIKITGCEFTDNGIPSEADGTVIYSNNVDNLLIEFTTFQSNTISTRAIETYNTKNVELNLNTFKKMKGPAGQNGGALLIQFSNNVTLCDCIFDSNTLQLGNETAAIPDVCGSAFFINLDDNLVFSNNTIQNHVEYLNSVITFNPNKKTNDELLNDNIPVKRKVVISDSKFLSNSYSKTTDGTGIGLFVEDYSEKIPETNDEDAYFLQIELTGCLFRNNGNSDCSASVIQWSRKTSFFSFYHCLFDSNSALQYSFLFNIQNSPGFVSEYSEIGALNTCTFLYFTPLTTEKQHSSIKQIELTITNSVFERTDETVNVNRNFFLTEGKSIYNSTFNIINCSILKLRSMGNHYQIKSTCTNLQVIGLKMVTTGLSYGIFLNNAGSTLDVIDSEFNNSQCAAYAEANNMLDRVTIRNCNFFYDTDNKDKDNSYTISVFTKTYIAENCNLLNLKNSFINFRGMVLYLATDIEISNSIFTKIGRPIYSFYDNDFSSITVTSCTITDTFADSCSFQSKNKIVNFINNSIKNSQNGGNGIIIDTVAQVTIDQCSFIKCYYKNNGEAEKTGAAITCRDTFSSPVESYEISNCEFSECSYDCAVANIQTNTKAPKFINVTISQITCKYSIKLASKNPNDECLFQNVSFKDITNERNNGGGGIGFWYPNYNAKSNSRISFHNCSFENTNFLGNNGFGGGAISIEQVDCRRHHVSIQFCTFINCNTKYNHGAAIAVLSTQSIKINDCYIEKCSVTDTSLNNGGVIYANHVGEKNDFDLINVTVNGANSLSGPTGVCYRTKENCQYSIINCTFINCMRNAKDSRSVLNCPYNAKLLCQGTNVIFNETEVDNPRGINVFSPIFKFDNCYFYRCGSKDSPEKVAFDGGAINYYEPTNVNRDEIMEITDCTFEKCNAKNSGAVKLWIYNGLPVVTNNSYIDICSTYILALIFDVNVQFNHILIEKQSFIRCTNLANDGGGSGLWVSNHRADGNIYPTYIDVIECDFIENTAQTCGGGAIGIGFSPSVRPTQLNIQNCTFIGNSCVGSEGGGAIWIRTSIPSYIVSCVFKDNHAGSDTLNLHGGAIYVRFTSSIPQFYLSNSEFINNSCLNPESRGQALFGIASFSSIVIKSCNFTDNGCKENPDSIIHTNSQLNIDTCSFVFTDKSESFSRGIYIGTSSELKVIDTEFINCTDLTNITKAGAILYEVTTNVDLHEIEISYCTFDSNTEGTDSCEMYFDIINPPEIYNCIFKNENTKTDLINYFFEESIDVMIPFPYYDIDSLTFIDCNLNNNYFFNFIDLNGEYVLMPEFTVTNWRVTSCTNFSLILADIGNFFIFESNFINNTNENILLDIQNEGVIQIETCIFNNNKVEITNDTNQNETGIIFIQNSKRSYIADTDFIDEEVHEEGFVIRTCSNIEINQVSILNCTKNSFSILVSIENNESTTSYFKLIKTTINESGLVSFEDKVDQILIDESVISNSINGIIYNFDLDDQLTETSDMIELSRTTFDNITDRALYMLVINEFTILGNAIKNCVKEDENSSPVFEIDIRNNETKEICFKESTFENNKFNNKIMNIGGAGVLISFLNSEEENKKEISYEFIDCYFISNQATQNGGAYSFVANSNVIIFTTFQGCTFRNNTCDKLKGQALYIEASNISIEDCIFQSYNDQLNINDDISQSFAVYITSEPDDTTTKNSFSPILDVTIVNCEFIEIANSNNITGGAFIVSTNKKVSVYNCSFYGFSSFENKEKSTTLTPVQIDSDDSVELTDITVGDSIGNIFNITSKTSITVNNCVFDTNSNTSETEKVEIQESDCFFMLCNCDKIISMDSFSISNHEKALLFTGNVETFSLTNSQISNCKTGIVYMPPDSINSPNSKESSLRIENSEFKLITNTAIMLNEMQYQIYIDKVVFNKCSNTEIKERTNDPMIGLKICISTNSVVKIVFNEVTFDENSYDQNERSQGGGGIGLSIWSDRSKKSATVEFNNCNFVSNRASGEKNSGGAIHFPCPSSLDKNLQFKSVSFTNCVFINNYASSEAGALLIEPNDCASASVIGCEFIMNTAAQNVGGLRSKTNCKFTIDHCNFINNSAISETNGEKIDSLYLSSGLSSDILSTNFSKAVLNGQESGYQAVFENNKKYQSKTDFILIKGCLFSIVNPSNPQVLLSATTEGSNTTVINSSFTHFFVYTGENTNNDNSNSIILSVNQKNTNDYVRIKASTLSEQFYHLACDANTKANFIDCCFDTKRSDTLSPDLKRSSNGNSVTNQVSYIDTIHDDKNLVCLYPEVIDELITAMAVQREIPSNSKNNKMIIGISSGVAAVVVISIIIIICVVVYKKKHSELKKTIEYDDDCREQLEQEEFDFINTKYNANEEISQTKVNQLNSWYEGSEGECEETEMEVFDL